MGERWLQLDERMAKIRPFLESEADVFPSYLPVSDIHLAAEQTFAVASRIPRSLPPASLDDAQFAVTLFIRPCSLRQRETFSEGEILTLPSTLPTMSGNIVESGSADVSSDGTMLCIKSTLCVCFCL